MRSLSLLAAVLGVVLISAGEPEMGSHCDPGQVNDLARVKVQAGTEVFVRDGVPGSDNCVAPLCAATDGLRPSCTKPSEGDLACANAGEGFGCHATVAFGKLASVTSKPAEACGADSIGAGYPCDGVTPDGEPTVLGNKCCAVAATTIDARAAEIGRAKFVEL